MCNIVSLYVVCCSVDVSVCFVVVNDISMEICLEMWFQILIP